MANHLIPVEERSLTPEEVDRLDRRRRRGQLFLVIGVEFLLVAILVTCWSAQDLIYGPGWARPMLDWDILTFLLAVIFIVAGIRLRRGLNEFISY